MAPHNTSATSVNALAGAFGGPQPMSTAKVLLIFCGWHFFFSCLCLAQYKPYRPTRVATHHPVIKTYFFPLLSQVPLGRQHLLEILFLGWQFLSCASIKGAALLLKSRERDNCLWETSKKNLADGSTVGHMDLAPQFYICCILEYIHNSLASCANCVSQCAGAAPRRQ